MGQEYFLGRETITVTGLSKTEEVLIIRFLFKKGVNHV